MSVLAALIATAAIPPAPPAPEDLLTVAETSDYHATATHAEVMTLVGRLDARSDALHVVTMGTTVEGKDIPLLLIGDPPVDSLAAAAAGKPVVFAFGNIHAGEVCGKEALLMLARDLALTPDHPWLEHFVIALAPIYNADGNDRMSPDNRPGQDGPADGMGERPNTQGLDLNRDYVKLESPEARALVATQTALAPLLTIDTHTTNGSQHRYTLTFDASLSPAGPQTPRRYVRDELLPTVSQRLEARTGNRSFFYGNFDADHTTWTTYSPLPRYGANYQGLKGEMSILSEACAYATYRDRVLCTYEFVREIVDYAAEHRDDLVRIADAAERETIEAGRAPRPDDVVGLRFELAAFPDPVTVLGTEAEHRVVHRGDFRATVAVRRPFAYVLPPGMHDVVAKLRQHGIVVEPFSGRVRVERYTVTDLTHGRRPFQGHRLRTVEVSCEPDVLTMPTGSSIVFTAQKTGTLIVTLLEPQSEDGLAAWNFFDDHIEIGASFPVMRVQWEADVIGGGRR